MTSENCKSWPFSDSMRFTSRATLFLNTRAVLCSLRKMRVEDSSLPSLRCARGKGGGRGSAATEKQDHAETNSASVSQRDLLRAVLLHSSSLFHSSFTLSLSQLKTHTIAFLNASGHEHSLVAQNRVPQFTPSAPRARAAASCLPGWDGLGWGAVEWIAVR